MKDKLWKKLGLLIALFSSCSLCGEPPYAVDASQNNESQEINEGLPQNLEEETPLGQGAMDSSQTGKHTTLKNVSLLAAGVGLATLGIYLAGHNNGKHAPT